MKQTLQRFFFTFDMDKKLGTICQLRWKERLSKFESDLLPKVTKIWLLKAAKFYRGWYGGGGGGGGREGTNLPPPHKPL